MYLCLARGVSVSVSVFVVESVSAYTFADTTVCLSVCLCVMSVLCAFHLSAA